MINNTQTISNTLNHPTKDRSVLNYNRYTEEENEIIAAAKANLNMLIKLSQGKGSEFLNGRQNGNLFVSPSYEIVTKAYTQHLNELETFKQLKKQLSNKHNDLLTNTMPAMQNFSINADKTINSINEIAEDVIDVETVSGQDENVAVCRQNRTVLMPAIRNQSNDLTNNFITVQNAIICHHDRVNDNFKLIDSLSFLYSFGSAYSRVPEGCNCLTCPAFPQLVYDQKNCLNNNCPGYYNSHIYLSDGNFTGKSIVEIYAEQEGRILESAYKQLQDKFGINVDRPLDEIHDINNSDWYQVKNIKIPPLNNGYNLLIPFYGEIGNVLGYCVIDYNYSSRQKKIVPLTAWAYGSEQRIYLFNIPFEKPYPLYNLNRLKSFSETPVVISDSIEIAGQKSSTNDIRFIYTSWLGGMEAIKDVDWSPLENRKIIIMLQHHSGYSDNQIHETAVSLIFELQKLNNIEIKIENNLNI